jgi:4-carboxymuconolactone decarboxylase
MEGEAMHYVDRMPPLADAAMNEAQRAAARALIAGPRGGVKGPFIPLMRSPELMDALGRVGEVLRFRSTLPQRLSEFAMLVVSREWTQQFEWAVHVPLALKAGVARETIEGLQEGRRPAMAEDEARVYDLCHELLRNRGLSNATYVEAVRALGEQGLVDLLATIGYFTTVSMIMNVAHTPAPPGSEPLAPFPCQLFELVCREVVDAAEACDEARIARHDAPEGEIGQPEVDRLLGEAGQPLLLQPAAFIRNLNGLAAYREAHQRERVRAAVVSFREGQRDARILQHVLRVPREAADVDMEGGEVGRGEVERHRCHRRAPAQRGEMRDALVADQFSKILIHRTIVVFSSAHAL